MVIRVNNAKSRATAWKRHKKSLSRPIKVPQKAPEGNGPELFQFQKENFLPFGKSGGKAFSSQRLSIKAGNQATAFVSTHTLAHPQTHTYKHTNTTRIFIKQMKTSWRKKAGKAFCWPPKRATPRKSA